MSLNIYKEFLVPHEEVNLTLLRLVEKVIQCAWNDLEANPRAGFDISNATEDPITHELFELICDRIFDEGIVNGFDANLFTKPTRESNLRDYQYQSLDKQPDLLFGMVNRPRGVRKSQDYIFVECKPIDSTHTVGSTYCDKGLIRFICGDYAWAMNEAIMVGYACDGYSVIPKLEAALKNAERLKTMPTLGFPTTCKISEENNDTEIVYISKHRRTFSYVETSEAAPPITIRHLWLKRKKK